MRYSPANITSLKEDEIFVFGSNLLGIHGKGAALKALQFGAEKNIGMGLRGQTYAIPTKYSPLKTLPINKIEPLVVEFIQFAKDNPQMKFLVTQIGCGYAGYKVETIAPLFEKAVNVKNIYLPKEFIDCLQED